MNGTTEHIKFKIQSVYIQGKYETGVPVWKVRQI